MDPTSDLSKYLLRTGRVQSSAAVLTPLAGGVSSEIYLVKDGARQFVVKRALPKLRTRDDWFADTSRNAAEHDCLAYIQSVSPGSVPRILFHDPEAGLFGMEYLGAQWTCWKSDLLGGHCRKADAERAGRLLGVIHRNSWGDATVQKTFATLETFRALRIDAYLIATARRNPELSSSFESEAERLAGTALALVHGDFSPKNMLRDEHRLILLDCEAAWFGDPAFDTAFLLNHLFLKSLHLPTWRDQLLDLACVARAAYVEALGLRWSQNLEWRIGRLLLMLLLARVDGKSPVEYLRNAADHDCIRNFVRRLLPGSVFGFDEILHQWRNQLQQT